MNTTHDFFISEKMIQVLNVQLAEKSQGGIYRTISLPQGGAAPVDIPRLMDHLVEQILSSRFTLTPPELAAMAGRRLLEILPFDSKNEETAAALKKLILDAYGCSEDIDGSSLFTNAVIIQS